MKEPTSNPVYAFIDSQNLNLSTSKSITRHRKLMYRGWKLDYKKFFTYLQSKFKVKKAFLFIGFMEDNTELYKALKEYGYEVIYKPTVTDEKGKTKGNIDADLVLYCAKLEYNNYSKAIIVSGDGDFHSLHKFLAAQQKLEKIIIPNENTESSLLDEFSSYKYYLAKDKKQLEYKTSKKKVQAQTSRQRNKTLPRRRRGFKVINL